MYLLYSRAQDATLEYNLNPVKVAELVEQLNWEHVYKNNCFVNWPFTCCCENLITYLVGVNWVFPILNVDGTAAYLST